MNRKLRAAIYPYGREFAPIVRHKELLEHYDIKALISPSGWGIAGLDAGNADKGGNLNIIVESDFLKSIDEWDTLIVADYGQNETFVKKIVSNIDFAIEKGKNVVCALPLDKHILNNLKSKSKQAGVSFNYLRNFKKERGNYQDYIEELTVPVVFVAGLTENSNKFEIQLSLREQLMKNGYKISQVGTRNYCEMMGFHSIPNFIFNNEVSEIEKIYLFNKFIKTIEQNEKPDLIIIGIPGGLMPYNNILTNKFGVIAFLLSHAVAPDFTIISTPNSSVNSNYFSLLNTSFKYKYGFETDCFNIATASIDFAHSKEIGTLYFNFFDTELVNNIISEKYLSSEIPVFNILNTTHKDKMVDLLIDTLSCYGKRKQVSIGGI